MRANPGGHIPPSEVVGRDALIQRLWRMLERQSLILLAERRIGKTSIIRRMEAEVAEGKLPVYRDLEGVHTPLEFVEMVYGDVKRYLSTAGRTAGRVRQFLSMFPGVEVGGVIKLPDTVAPHWKALLTKTIEDLSEHQDRTVIFFWDEVPLMLYNIKQDSGEKAAMEILNVLRSLRQMNSDLRMVFTGSIGLHNVINSLRRVGYANDPSNDMNKVDVPPLSLEDAEELAFRLLQGEGILENELRESARAIAKAVDKIPYYIHHVVDQMAIRRSEGNAAAVEEIVGACLIDPHDPWDLRHYRQRINVYYTPEEGPVALAFLDILAASEEPLTFDELFNLLKHKMKTEDQEMARETLTLLQTDHYIIRKHDGTFRFRFPLIQRWWRLDREL